MSTAAAESRKDAPSPTPTLAGTVDPEKQKGDHGLHESDISSARKYSLLLIFSIAQLIDVMMASSMIIAATYVAADINLNLSEVSWIIVVYSITFASFLLIAGRVSDLYSPSVCFAGGFLIMGILSLATSFWSEKHGFLIFRALTGIAGSFTIPSAVHIICHLFPVQKDQDQALSLFGLAGAIGNVIGLVIAGALLEASWRWIFRFLSIIAIPLSVMCWFMVPTMAKTEHNAAAKGKWKRLDLIGCFCILGALVLIVLSMTNGNLNGFTTASFIAPFVISIVMFVLFFVWESRLADSHALLPNWVWLLPNLLPLVLLAPMSYIWWSSSGYMYSLYYEDALHSSPILVAVRLLPQGVSAFIAGGVIGGGFPGLLKTRIRELASGAVVLMSIGTILMIFSDGVLSNYWRYCFPGFILGSAGACILTLTTNIGIITSLPPKMAGIGGGLFNVVAQMGLSVGLSVFTAVYQSISGQDVHNWKGARGAFWIVFALPIFLLVILLALFRANAKIPESAEAAAEEVSESL